MTSPETKTPRTDAAIESVRQQGLDDTAFRITLSGALALLARELERENNELRAALENLVNSCLDSRGERAAYVPTPAYFADARAILERLAAKAR